MWRLDGSEQWVLIHIEVQGEPDDDFPERMYVYNYRAFDRYHRPVVSLAILCDDSQSFHPQSFAACDLWGCEVGIHRFPVVKLREYNERWTELAASDNPFATVVMAHLKARATRQTPEERYRWKVRLVRRLYERGYGRDDVAQLFSFIDWVMSLPAELETRFDDEIKDYETEQGMQYVTHIERRGIEQGIQQGRQEGRQEGVRQGEARLLRRQLTRRHGALPSWAGERLEKAEPEQLETWAERVLTAKTLEEVFG